jgi:hypothetical protein
VVVVIGDSMSFLFFFFFFFFSYSVLLCKNSRMTRSSGTAGALVTLSSR